MNFSLSDKTYVIMGVANKRSLAWGIAQALDKVGARLIFTYASQRFEKPVKKLAETLTGQESLFYECDVASDESISEVFDKIEADVGTIHGVAHCIAFAEREDLKGEFVDTSRDGFLLAHNMSAFSLVGENGRASWRERVEEWGGVRDGGERVE